LVRPSRALVLAGSLLLAGSLACANRGMEAPAEVSPTGAGADGGTALTDAGQDRPTSTGGAGAIAATGGAAGTAGAAGSGAGGSGGANAGGNGGTNAGGAAGTNAGGNAGQTNAGGAGGNGGANAGGAAGTNAGGSAGQTNAGGAGGQGGGGGNAGGNSGGNGGVGGASNGGAGGQALPAPFAYYPFDQTAGPAITDASGNGHDGTLVGTASFLAGVINNDLSLPNATADYVALPSALLQTVTNVTITLWVNVRTDQTWQRIFDFGTGTKVYMFLTPHAGTSNVARFAISTNGNGAEQRLDATAVLPLGTWTHVAIVLGTGGGTLYINGATVATNATLALRPADLGATGNNWLGHSQFAADPAFDGQIDELRIYDSALTAAQIATIYTAR
jgi:hypothetical protein